MNELAQFLTASYRYFGMAGCLVITFAMLYSALGYCGRKQERFSALNHFISELGEIGISARAPVFNNGLIVSGLLLIPFTIGFGVYLGSLAAVMGTLAGIWAAVSCILVGFFPMNNLDPHIKAAVSYFRSALLMALLFGVAILAQPAGQVKISPWASTVSLLSVAAYGSFLFLGRLPNSAPPDVEPLDPTVIPDRPRIWGMAILEWLAFISTILWFFAISFF